jgi:hypothetical protein
MSTLRTHHKVALVAAALTSSIALFDAATAATTGHYSVFADDSDSLLSQAGSSVVHGACYAALTWVLVREADRFSEYGRAVRITRRVLVVSLAVLGVGFVAVAPALTLAGITVNGPAGTLWGLVASIAFFAMIGTAVVLSVVVWRRNLVGVGGQVLRLLLPVAAGTILLGVLGSPWAHPAYVETTINVGIALIGAGHLDRVGSRPDPVQAAV